MPAYNSPLENVKVASPCKVDWNSMTGNEQVRFCSQCNLNVYNLSNMTKEAAEDLLRKAEGKLCVRYYRRADGTIITNDCPVGLTAARKRVARIATATFSAALSFFAGVGLYAFAPINSSSLNSNKIIERTKSPDQIVGEMPAVPVTIEQPEVIMGGLKAPEPVAEMGDVAVALEEPKTGIACLFPPSAVEDPRMMIPPPPPMPAVELPEPPPPPIVRRSEGVLRGNAITRVNADYPQLARSANIQGEVKVEITIGQDGSVIQATILSGHPLLQKSSIDAAKQWQFKPTKLNDTPVKVQGVLTFRFSL